MTGEGSTSLKSPEKHMSSREFLLRKYETKVGLWKVAIGTSLVGVASVLIPGAVQFWESYFENQRATEQIAIEKMISQRDTITTFIEYALNEDIELRLRMAEYFSVVTEGDSSDPNSERSRWEKYYLNLNDLRRSTKNDILDLERRRVLLERIPINKLTDDDVVDIVNVDLKLKWLYGELGRAARGKSVVATANESEQATVSNQEQDFCVGRTTTKRDSDPNHLHPEFRRLVQELVSELNEEGLPFKFFEGYRAPSRQALLYSKRPRVTWVGPWSSTHQFGLSADLVLQLDGIWSWDNSGEKAEWWNRMHELAKEKGLVTLTNKKGQTIEIPHVQLPGIKISELLNGNFPEDGDRLWAENLAQNAFAWTDCPGKLPEPFLSFLEAEMNKSDSQ